MPTITCLHRMACLTATLLIGFLVARAQEPEPTRQLTKAPPLLESKVSSVTEHGTWDDVFVDQAQDFMILRRDDEFFSLNVTESTTPRKLAKIPQSLKTRIVNGAALDGKFWLFVNSSNAVPAAIDANSGVVVSFDIPGLTVPGSQLPEIQSCAIVPHAKAAILMISGGDRTTWPRPGNRPLYFWFSLKSGLVNRLPIGWDLWCFSETESIAAFVDHSHERNAFHSIDMSTGETTTSWPVQGKAYCIPYDWGNKQRVKPLHPRYWSNLGISGSDNFAGLSVDGVALRIDIGTKAIRYLAMAKAVDGFAGFRLRRNGGNAFDPHLLWLTPIKMPSQSKAIARDVTDFSMLNKGNVVFVTDEQGGKREAHKKHFDAFVYSHANQISWNILDGVERLPKLDKELIDADYIDDYLTIRLTGSFGTDQHPPRVMCLYEHRRGDRRANLYPENTKTVLSQTWRRAFVITHDGQRSLTPLFRQGGVPEELWLHHSGMLITGSHVWGGEESARTRRIRISTYAMQ